MTWAQDQRLEFIRAKIAAGEQVQRSDLRDKFYISTAACATTFRAFEAKYPDLMRYCKTTKAYVPAGFVTPPSDWKTRALAAEAERDQLSARLEAVLARDAEWSPSGSKTGCNCINLSHKAEQEYETGKCPHQLARQALQAPDTARRGEGET